MIMRQYITIIYILLLCTLLYPVYGTCRHHRRFRFCNKRRPGIRRTTRPFVHIKPFVPITPVTPGTTVVSTVPFTTSECSACPPLIDTQIIIAIGIWNAIAGGDCIPSPTGEGSSSDPFGHTVINIFDRNVNTNYINCGPGRTNTNTLEGGTNTGFYTTLNLGRCVIRGFRFSTATDNPQRDPLVVTIEGSNAPSFLLTLGTSWTLIYNGTTGLNIDPGRKLHGILQMFDNIRSFNSYRVLITKKRGIASCTQYSEFTFYGECASTEYMINTLNDKAITVWNTRIGGDSSLITIGERPAQGHSNYSAIHVFDRNVDTFYFNPGASTKHVRSMHSGLDSGFYVTLSAGHCILQGFRFATTFAISGRDPLEVTIEGSNAPASLLTLGRSWTLIYNGTTGLNVDPGRKKWGSLELFDNQIPFNSYRILISKKRAIEIGIQFSEIYFYGQCVTNLHLIDTSNDKPIAIWNTTVARNSFPTCIGMGQGQSYPGHAVINIFDQDTATKYENFGPSINGMSTVNGGINTGFYVTLNVEHCIVQGFQFSTADNRPECDPLVVTIEGSNASSSSSSLTFGENWSLIYNGSTGLTIDPGRMAAGPIQTFDNKISFNSYRILISKKRGVHSSTQYSEFAFYGKYVLNESVGPIFNISRSLFVNGLSIESAISIQLLDNSHSVIGTIRVGDYLNLTEATEVKYINIAFRNYIPQLYTFTKTRNIANGFITIHETDSYIFLTFLNEVGGDEQIDPLKLVGSSSIYKHSADFCPWKKKLEQHRQLLMDAFGQMDFSIIKYRMALSSHKSIRVPVTDADDDAMFNINAINKNATIKYIQVITKCKNEIKALNVIKSNHSIWTKKIIALKNSTIQNTIHIMNEIYASAIINIEKLPINLQDSIAEMFITNYEMNMDFMITICERINELPENLEEFLQTPIPKEPCVLI